MPRTVFVGGLGRNIDYEELRSEFKRCARAGERQTLCHRPLTPRVCD